MFIRHAKLLTAIALPFLLIFVSGCDKNTVVEDTVSDDPPVTRTVERPGDFDIELGETVLLGGTNLQLTFSVVQQDSRCPSDVVCVTEGNAVITISTDTGGILRKDYDISIPGLVFTPYEFNDVVRIGDLAIKLVELNPYPDTSRRGDDPYRASFQRID